MQLRTFTALAAGAIIPLVSGAATTTFPTAAGATTLSAPMSVTGTYDGGMKRFGRGLSPCSEADGGSIGAVFILESGATLKNAIIGSDQYEGVHCNGPCTIQNVWWEDVCEDALTILQSSGTSYVTGGGAKGASDKVIQMNGKGTVVVKDFFVSDFGKLWRSCGNCSGNGGPRKLIVDGVVATGGTVIGGANSNYGDTVTISNTCGAAPAKMCQVYEGCDKAQGDCESEKLSTGFDGVTCIDGGGNKATC
ncbi:uncharacterized protein LAJ45_00510 [Morchella importuna]|uniref:uncharacterized protein n=1 Tax=Morchella importuna TaxID=1174673 RepID=UPI001E8E6716|nr:uncharacterized protein LAJ45_00510 [Morchella importuna]KAH8155500.1 hypothetical protein LAJ45_00510 [Morchella importuna]